MSEKSDSPVDLRSFEIERREATTTEIARKLLQYLLVGRFEPGYRLPSERNLASELGVGRSVVREALKSLTLLGIVEVRQGDGTFLRSTESELLPSVIEWGLLLGTRSIDELVEVRRYLETIVASLAAQRRTDADLERLDRHLREMYEAEDAPSFVAADMAFHIAIAETARNAVLLQIMTNVRSLLRVWMRKNVEDLDDRASVADEHRPVLDAIRAGDPDRAREAMRDHMDRALTRLGDTLTRQEETD